MGKDYIGKMEIEEHPKRGEVYIVSLDPTAGSEIGKQRPALVISNNINNRNADTVTVVPITSNTAKVYPFEVFLPKGAAGLQEDSKVKCEQIRTIDKSRLKRKIGEISEDILKEVEKAILIHLGIDCLEIK